MIEQRKGNLLTEPGIDIICHQANLFHTFGGGIAATIKDVYPEAFKADLQTAYGSRLKLGTTSVARTSDGKFIVNCYTQTGMGATDRNTSYDDIRKIFTEIEKIAVESNKVVGVPYKYGCGLAGGDWNIVHQIFVDIFGKSKAKLVIVDFN